MGSVRAITQFRGATYYAIYGRGIERMARAGVLVGLAWPNAREVISLMADGEERLLIGTTRRRARVRWKDGARGASLCSFEGTRSSFDDSNDDGPAVVWNL